MPRNSQTDNTFAGFRSPNIQVPDELFDELMADLSGAELAVLEAATQAALKGLVEKHIIIAIQRMSAEKEYEATAYALNLGTPYTENRTHNI